MATTAIAPMRSLLRVAETVIGQQKVKTKIAVKTLQIK